MITDKFILKDAANDEVNVSWDGRISSLSVVMSHTIDTQGRRTYFRGMYFVHSMESVKKL